MKTREAVGQMATVLVSHTEFLEAIIIMWIRESAVCSTQTAVDAYEQAWVETGNVKVERDRVINAMDLALQYARENRG